jgi:HEAT repeat protein
MSTFSETAAAGRLAALDALPEGVGRDQAILAALEDEAPVVRDRAIRLATRYIEPQVLGELVADETNAIRRNAAITALERQGPYAVPHLRTMLARPEVDVVMFALQMLSRIGDPLAVHGVVPLVRHSDPNVAQSAIEALGQLRHREAVPTLLQLLKGDLWLQLAAIDALGEIGDPAAVPLLVALVPDSIVAEPAVAALLRIAAPESLEALIDRLVAVRERSLRDGLLLAIGVVIDLHPDPVPVAVSYSGRIELDPSRDLLAYLDEILQWDPTLAAADAGGTGGNTRDGDGLLRAATALTVVAGLCSMYPPVLIRIATDESAAWAVTLFRRHPGELAPALRQLLRHDDLRVRRGALLAGTFQTEDLALVLEHLEAADELIRAAACRVLGLIRNLETVPLLVRRLREGGAAERAAAVDALAEFPVESLGALEPCLGREAPEPVQAGALEVLGRRKMERFEEQKMERFEARIIDLARHESPVVRRAALRAAAQLSGLRAEVALIRALADRHVPIQVDALELLVKRDHGKTIPTLAALLGTDDSLRCHVIRALGQMRAMEAVPQLESLYDRCALHEQVEIVLAMTRIGGPRIAGFLRARLSESEPEIRRVGARGLATLVDRTHLPLLLQLAGHADWCIRAEAARGLGRLGMAECRDALLTLARDVEPSVASTARDALASLRKGAPAAA